MRVLLALAVCAAIVAGVLWSTRWGGSPEARLERAARNLQQGDPQAAQIDAKAVLQSLPGSAQARFLLARALLALDQLPAAEAELERALAAGLPLPRAAAALAETLVRQGRHADVLRRLSAVRPTEAADAAMLHTQLGWAYAVAGDLPAAGREAETALKQVKDHVPALELRARLLAGSGDLTRALAVVDDALARHARDARLVTLRGDLLRGRPGNDKAAAEAYRQALAIDAKAMPPRASLILLQARAGDLAAARKDWAMLQKARPGNGLVAYFDAYLALKEGDANRARAATQKLLQAGADSAAVRVLAGQAEFRLGALDTARDHFGRAMTAAPADPVPRHHLAMVLLRQGQARQALEVLGPLIGRQSADGVALALAARARLQGGEIEAASALFDRAARAAPGNVALRVEKAQLAIRTGRESAGVAELESLAASDGGAVADLALVTQRLRRGEFDQALALVAALERKDPASALAEHLRGLIAWTRNDKTAARAHFERALAKDPADLSLLERLAALDLSAGDLPAAMRRYEAVLKRDPGHVAATLGLLELRRRSGTNAAQLRTELEQAVTAHPQVPAFRLALIDHLLRAGERDAALSASQAAQAALPADATVLERHALVLQTLGDRQQALTAWRRLAGLPDATAAVRLRAAQSLRQLGAGQEADALLAAAAKADPQSAAVRRAAATQALRQGQVDQALALAKELQQRDPDAAAGFEVEGEVEAARQRWDRAIAAFGRALRKQGPERAAPGMHQALLDSQGEDAALRFQRSWLQEHPDDRSYLLFLSDLARSRSDWAEAETLLQRLRELAPGSALVHNNLAWVLRQQRKPEALALAERAVELAPSVPAFLDTLASLQADAQQLALALRSQARAVELAPGSARLRVNHARLLIAAGQGPQALETLGAVSPPAELAAEAARLREQAQALGRGLAVAAKDVTGSASAGSTGGVGGAMSKLPWNLILSVLGALLLIGLPAWLGLALLRRAGYEVRASLALGCEPERVAALVGDLSAWERWSNLTPFLADTQRRFEGPRSGVGARCTWRDAPDRQRGRVAVQAFDAAGSATIEVLTEKPRHSERAYVFTWAAAPAGGTTVELVAQGTHALPARMWAVLVDVDALLRRRLKIELERLQREADGEPASADEPAAAPQAA